MKPVRLAISKVPRTTDERSKTTARTAARKTAAPVLIPASVSWLKFGENLVYCGEGKSWGEFKQRARSARLKLRERSDAVDRDRLHVVVQKGRLFQREHPDVPVLIDKGRYLLVDIEPKRARKIGRSDVPCFVVQPVDALPPTRVRGRHRVVFDTATRVARSTAPTANPAIQQLVDRILLATYKADLTSLVAFNTRNSMTPQYAAACDFVDRKLAALGYATSRQSIDVNGSESQNVVAIRSGTGPASRGVVLVSAHLDSINLEGTATSPAPGADDDGSGSAGVIEIARALKDLQGKHDLRFVLFGGEEEGLFGSKQFVAALTPAARKKIRAVVHMDMIGSLNSPSPTVLLEGAALSRAVIDGLSAAAATYTRLAVQTSLNPFNSDHVPFIRKGVPAVLTIEGTDDANHEIHSARDTLDRINFDLALDFLRMNTAFVAGELMRA
jgi:hypothetical protein